MSKSSFYCQSCGNETPKWHGKCPSCKQWNTIVEEIRENKPAKTSFGISSASANPILIQDVSNDAMIYRKTPDLELNLASP